MKERHWKKGLRKKGRDAEIGRKKDKSHLGAKITRKLTICAKIYLHTLRCFVSVERVQKTKHAHRGRYEGGGGGEGGGGACGFGVNEGNNFIFNIDL